MFDFGFSELIVIAVVLLVVVGPERLPKVARTAGHLLGRLQRYVSDVKSDIQREMQLEDLKKLQQQVEQQARELESSVRGQMAKVEAEVADTAADVKAEVSELPAPAPVAEASPAGIRSATGTSDSAPSAASNDDRARPHREVPEVAQQAGTQRQADAPPADDARAAQLQLHLDPAVTSRPAEKA